MHAGGIRVDEAADWVESSTVLGLYKGHMAAHRRLGRVKGKAGTQRRSKAAYQS